MRLKKALTTRLTAQFRVIRMLKPVVNKHLIIISLINWLNRSTPHQAGRRYRGGSRQRVDEVPAEQISPADRDVKSTDAFPLLDNSVLL
jgi:hypothetical protein